MRYSLTPMHCRPWTLHDRSLRLIESHYASLLRGGHSAWKAIGGKTELNA